MSGGIDIKALEVPKRLFGAARTFEEGGSLTVLGTALIETGRVWMTSSFRNSREPGTWSWCSTASLAERRVFPAMDLAQSGTRKEERILPPEILRKVTLLRRTLISQNPTAAMETSSRSWPRSLSNEAFLARIASQKRPDPEVLGGLGRLP